MSKSDLVLQIDRSRSPGGGEYASRFEWRDIGYTAPTKDKKQIINGISGGINAGQMLAVMGPSGAGKSTFLDVIARRKKQGASGTVSYNGTNDFSMAEVASYVEQDDALLGNLTVSETLYYTAKLSASAKTDDSIVRDHCNSALSILGLEHVRNNRIGTPISRGISGGQKRRVTIGTAIVSSPRVLFLDEPTSGLDSATAFQVVSALKKLAQTMGTIIIVTIHQPSWETFSLFDDLLLLGSGQVLFHGPVGNVDAYCAHIEKPIPAHVNPADHILNLVNTDFASASPTASSQMKLDSSGLDYAKLWLSNTTEFGCNSKRAAIMGTSANGGANKNNVVEAPLVALNDSCMSSFVHHTVVLTRRSFLSYRRNLLGYGVRAAMFIGMGVLMALVWLNLGYHQSRVSDRLSVFFFSVAFLAFMSVSAVPAFLEERSVIMREHANGLYGFGAYTLSNSIVAFPFLFACTLLFCVLTYWSIGLHPGATTFFRFLLYVFLGIYAAESQSVLVAAIVPIFVAALAIIAFANGLWMVVQGYFMQNLPAFWKNTFHYIDYEMYAFQLLMNNDLKGLTFACDVNAGSGACQCMYPSALQQLLPPVCAFTGDDILDYLGINNINQGEWVGILIALIVFMRLMLWVTMRLKA